MNKHCSLCDLSFNTVQNLERHLTREVHIKNKRKADEMAAKDVATKATKTTRRTILRIWVGEVGSNFYDDDLSEKTLRKVTANMKELNEDNVVDTIEELNSLYSDIRGVLEPLAEVVKEDTLSASEEEKAFFRSLGRKIEGVPESMSSSGVPIAGTPADYQNSVATLEMMKTAMLKRVNALDYEIKRREMEPEYDVTEWLIENFTPAKINLKKSYTQEY
jgi:hypothetical protein